MAAEPSLKVSELFHSIQGESFFAGFPCAFIRLAGCNLRCSYCDSAYTWEDTGLDFGLSQVFEFVQRYPAALVELTGGEPLLQEAVYPFMEQLLAAGRTVLLETNGSINISRVPPGVVRIMDLKCPDSGMHSLMDLDNPALLGPDDEVKFVICSRQDYDWAVDKILTHDLAGRTKISFSPAAGRLAAVQLAEWLLADQLQVRLQLQLHRILWPEKERGF